MHARRLSTVLLLTLVLAGCAPAGDVTGSSEAIVNGDPAPDDVAVVGLMHAGAVYCSGTLVTPSFVLTAGHCVAEVPPDEVLFVDADGNPLTVTVVGVDVDPDYDAGTLRADLGLVELAYDVDITPLPMATRQLADGDVGSDVRVVGFGRFDPAHDPGAVPPRRMGTATLAAFTDWNFTMTPSPSQTCMGDSGGPSLQVLDGVETIVGVHSFGDPSCASFATDVRVDAFVSSFVRPTMDSRAGDLTWRSRVLGQQCSASFGAGSAPSAVVVALALALVVWRRGRRPTR